MLQERVRKCADMMRDGGRAMTGTLRVLRPKVPARTDRYKRVEKGTKAST